MSYKERKMTYEEAVHAMQSGVAVMMDIDATSTQPKHLRVGVNCAMCDHAALVQLLVDKGVITNQEYKDAITEEMNTEVRRYEARIYEATGRRVTLG